MPYQLETITEPTTEPVSLNDARLWCRFIDGMTDDDDLLSALICSARRYCEAYTRRTLTLTTYKMIFDCFPSWFYLPRSQLYSVDQIQYYDADGTLQTLDSSVYIVGSGISSPARVALAPDEEWPDTQSGRIEAVEVTFTTGISDPDKVPQTILTAMKQLIAHWYENRESVVIGATPANVPQTVTMLLDIERIYEAPS